MEAQPIVVQQERIDDVPLLLGMMRRMQIAEIIDKHLPPHHLHQGLSAGNLAVGWIAYILSESDHRKSAVQDWANRLPHTLESFFGVPLRPHEFNDDRLGLLLKNLAAADWAQLEGDLFSSCFEVYELPTDVFRLDATTSYGYHTIEPDGLLQLGHSKDHRPDLPQLKIMAAVTQPLAFPVATDIVAGNESDDGLYWPTICQVKAKVGGRGVLFGGDCKMAALETRARIAKAGDYYLTPLPHTGETAQQFDAWVDTALEKDNHGELTRIYQSKDAKPADWVAQGYEFTRTLQAEVDGQLNSWTERVQVVQSQAQLKSQRTKLHKDLQQAEQALRDLTKPGQGRKLWRDEAALQSASAAIAKEHGVAGLLDVEVSPERREKKNYGKPGRPSETAVATVEVDVCYRITAVQRNQQKLAAAEQRLGWRALVSNAPAQRLTLAGSVLTYRQGGGLERPFHQLKDKPLGLSPLFVRRDEQVLGLTRLVLIALRVLTLIEIVLRGQLAANGEQLQGLHEGQKNRKEGRPTAKRMLRAVSGLQMTLSVIQLGQHQWWSVPPLPHLLVRILDLLGLPASLYTSLGNPGPCPPADALAPAALGSSG